jgi:hypothetical protein
MPLVRCLDQGRRAYQAAAENPCNNATLEPSSRDEPTPTFRRLDTFVRKLLDEGIQDGSIAPCDTKITALSIVGAMHWLTRWYRPDGEINAQAIADRVIPLFELGLKPIGSRLNSL